MEMKERQFGEIITFYSYKGGTGRSMALANVAYLLAKKAPPNSKPQLIIDWDLEAPGLHRFFYRDFQKRFGAADTEKYANALEKAPGLIDYLINVFDYYKNQSSKRLSAKDSDTLEAQELFQEVLYRFPLKKYLLPVDDLPSLFVLKAGCNFSPSKKESYAENVRKFDWEEFYSKYGSFFILFRDHLMTRYSYVLIDSRTGLTDTSGICTRVMSEKLVAVFVPNHQNIEGIRSVILSAVTYRRNSRDPRGLLVFPLASRLDISSSKLREIWWHGGQVDGHRIKGYQEIFENLFTELYDLDKCHLEEYFNATQIPHDSEYAYGEKIAARFGTKDRLSIGQACAKLTERLTELSAPWEEIKPELKTIKVFLTASAELNQDREKVQILISRENKKLVKQGVFLELNSWEDFSIEMPKGRLQVESKTAITESDIFISLFGTTLGKYAEEEFALAQESFREIGKPKYLYTFFKDVPVTSAKANIKSLERLLDLKDRIAELGHWAGHYKSTEDLMKQLKKQFELIADSTFEDELTEEERKEADVLLSQLMTQANLSAEDPTELLTDDDDD